MGTIVQLAEWRDRGDARRDDSLARLEAIVARLETMAAQNPSTKALAPKVETELLAIIGELSIGLVAEAADRAERLEAGLSR